jgi:hypothetical protein
VIIGTFGSLFPKPFLVTLLDALYIRAWPLIDVVKRFKQIRPLSHANKSWIACLCSSGQGCQMVCFQTKNPNLGKIFRASDWKMLKYFMAIWNILWIFGIFVTIRYILCSFGTFFLFWYHAPRKIWQPWFWIEVWKHRSVAGFYTHSSKVKVTLKVTCIGFTEVCVAVFDGYFLCTHGTYFGANFS